jgi:hypothetical protein
MRSLSLPFSECFGRNTRYTINEGIIVEREVTTSLLVPLLSVILWRVFVLRPFEMCRDKVLLVWIMKDKILSYSFKSGRRYNFVRSFATLINRTYLFFSISPYPINKPRKVYLFGEAYCPSY